MKKNNYPLNAEERKLELEIQNGEWVVDQKHSSLRKQLELAAKKMTAKDKKINLRISSLLLNQVKTKAAQSGLSYQTYINSLIANHISGKNKLNK